MRSKLMILVLVLTTVALSGSALAEDPIAHYPLIVDGTDATGNNGDFEIENCLFEDGGLHVYAPYGAFTCQTPGLATMDRTLFSFTVEFRIQEYPTDITGDGVMPVMWVGRSWRTLGFEINPEGYAGIRVGSTADFIASDVQVSLGEWHTARITWNEDLLIASCYMDGELIMLAERGPVSTSADMRLTPINYANGHVFTGLIRNLYVYNTDDPGIVATDSSTMGSVKALYR